MLCGFRPFAVAQQSKQQQQKSQAQPETEEHISIIPAQGKADCNTFRVQTNALIFGSL